LFGNNPPSAPSNSLFGNSAGTGLFGATAGSLFGAPASGQPSVFANNSNLFTKPAFVEAEDDDDNEPLEEKDEVPMYATESSKVEFKDG
jgi:hypothetical protein